MLIRNYGLFWKRECVGWGRPKVPGHLKGVPAKNRTDQAVDFREQQGVYVLYDDNFKILYVGQAGANGNQRLFQRLRQHKVDSLAQRWTRFSWFGTRKVNKDHTLGLETSAAHPSISDILNHIEGILIASTEPPHNRQAGKFGPLVDQYLQHVEKPKKDGPTIHEMIKELWDDYKRSQANKS